MKTIITRTILGLLLVTITGCTSPQSGKKREVLSPPLMPPQQMLIAGDTRVSTNTYGLNLTWSASPTPEVTGYKLYVRKQPGINYTNYDAGNSTNYTVRGLCYNTNYYFAATAYTSTGTESDYSPEFGWPPPLETYFTIWATFQQSSNPADTNSWVTLPIQLSTTLTNVTDPLAVFRSVMNISVTNNRDSFQLTSTRTNAPSIRLPR